MNWDVICGNFISFWTSGCKYKFVLGEKYVTLLYRKEGTGATEKTSDYAIKM